jgi:hypothetical protein
MGNFSAWYAGTMTRRAPALLLLPLLLAGCPDRAAPSAARAEPKPLEPLLPLAGPGDGGEAEREALFRVGALAVVGPVAPEGAVRIRLEGDAATVDGKPFQVAALRGPVVLEPSPETWLVQAAPLLAALDDAHLAVLVQHPDAPVAYPVTLRDEPAYQAWIDEAVPGKLRVIHRADGFELQTNMGKLPGGDPKGPTVPLRGGHQDLPTLRRGLEKVRSRFADAPDVCFVPSFGMELQQTVRAFAADFGAGGTATFPGLCLVYPRPPRDGGP